MPPIRQRPVPQEGAIAAITSNGLIDPKGLPDARVAALVAAYRPLIAKLPADHKVLIGAANLTNGKFYVGKFYVADLREVAQIGAAADGCYTEWLLASAAVPASFPPRYIDGHGYVDGGVRFGAFLGNDVQRVVRGTRSPGDPLADVNVRVNLIALFNNPVTANNLAKDAAAALTCDRSTLATAASLCPPYDAAGFGHAAVVAYGEGNRERLDQQPVTMGAFRTDHRIATRFTALVAAAEKEGAAAFRLLDRARAATTGFGRRDSYDLIEFARNVARTGAGALATAADALAQAVEAARIDSVAIGAQVGRARGLSFWFPRDAAALARDRETYRTLAFDKATGWTAYLDRHRGSGTPTGVRSLSERTDAAPLALGAKAVSTVIQVHGIGNKPSAAILKSQWDSALFGNELGDRSRMCWVNRDHYPVPTRDTCAGSDVIRVDDDEVSTRGDGAGRRRGRLRDEGDRARDRCARRDARAGADAHRDRRQP